MNAVYEVLRPRSNDRPRLVSAEIERLVVRPTPSANTRPTVLRYEPDLRKVVEAMAEDNGWKPVYRPRGRLLAAVKDGAAISFEPGGQMEVSAAPKPTVGEWWSGQVALDRELAAVAPAEGMRRMYIGLNPWETPGDIPLLPSPRYRLMDEHFQKLGGRGREMMRLSVGLQINLDYSSERRALELLRASFLLAPPLSALFSNSPFLAGCRGENLSERHLIWCRTDPTRAGFIEEALRPDFSLKDYAALMARTPLMYAFDPGGEVLDIKGASLSQLPSKLIDFNARAAVQQMFTEARLKPGTLELRFFDPLPPRLIRGAAALSVGLLYDEENLKTLLGRVPVKAEPLRRATARGAKDGLVDEELYAFARELFSMAERGLLRRSAGEENYLAPVERLLRDRKTPAEYWRHRHGDGGLTLEEPVF